MFIAVLCVIHISESGSKNQKDERTKKKSKEIKE